MKNIPTVGDSLIYIPALNDKVCRANGATANPAIVTQSFGDQSLNLTVFPVGEKPVFYHSVQPMPKGKAVDELEGFWLFKWDFEKLS